MTSHEKEPGHTSANQNDDVEGQHSAEPSNFDQETDAVKTEDSSTSDPNIVTWDGPDDEENPVNWTSTKRWTHIVLVSAVTLVASLSSSVFAPGVPELMQEFNSTNDILGSFVVTIYVLGLATGPIFFAPLSELYGRLPVQHAGNIGFLIWTIACAVATDLNMLIGFRLLQGIFAAVPLTNAGGVIADTVRQEERGFALSMYTFALLGGPVIGAALLLLSGDHANNSAGPVCGGFLTAATSWRWAFWLCVILVRPSGRSSGKLTKRPIAWTAARHYTVRLA